MADVFGKDLASGRVTYQNRVSDVRTEEAWGSNNYWGCLQIDLDSPSSPVADGDDFPGDAQ